MRSQFNVDIFILVVSNSYINVNLLKVYKGCDLFLTNSDSIGGIMVNVLAPSAVDHRGFELRSCQSKDYKI